MFRERMQMMELIGRVTDTSAPAAANCIADGACPHCVPTFLLPLLALRRLGKGLPQLAPGLVYDQPGVDFGGDGPPLY